MQQQRRLTPPGIRRWLQRQSFDLRKRRESLFFGVARGPGLRAEVDSRAGQIWLFPRRCVEHDFVLDAVARNGDSVCCGESHTIDALAVLTTTSGDTARLGDITATVMSDALDVVFAGTDGPHPQGHGSVPWFRA